MVPKLILDYHGDFLEVIRKNLKVSVFYKGYRKEVEFIINSYLEESWTHTLGYISLYIDFKYRNNAGKEISGRVFEFTTDKKVSYWIEISNDSQYEVSVEITDNEKNSPIKCLDIIIRDIIRNIMPPGIIEIKY